MLTRDYKTALITIARELNTRHIHWAIGGSCLLYLSGIPVIPSDIDILIDPVDHTKLTPLLKMYPIVRKPRKSEYRTTHFYTLMIQAIEVDIMLDFQIKTPTGWYQFPFAIVGHTILDNTTIPLSSLDDWKTAYHHMGRHATFDKITSFQTFQIETDRLVLSHLKQSDLDAVFPYVSDETNMYYERRAFDRIGLQRFFAEVIPSRVIYGVRLKETDKLIGHLYFGPHGPKEFREYMIGYIFHPDHHNQGFCTEATSAFIEYGFDKLSLHRISARCNPDNIGSWKVMEKVGLKREGLLEKRVCFKHDSEGNPIWWDELVYGITKDDWVSR